MKQEDMVERFLREARSAQKIQSRHGIRVLDTGSLDDGAPYIVMEYLEGRDLSDVLEKDGPPPVDRAVDWILQACEAIAEAHAAKTSHPDLKPSNLFLAKYGDDEWIKVLDFGVSKSSASDSMSLKMTKTSALLGTPLYMSPEQLTSAKDVDERTDIWAIGVMLYELVSGRLPFDAPTLPELSVLVLAKAAPALIGPNVPSGLSEVVATCLRTQRNERFQNLAELALALTPFGSPAAKISAERIVGVVGLPSNRTPIRSSQHELGVTMPMGDAPPTAASASGRAVVRDSAESSRNVSDASPASPASSRRVGLFVAVTLVTVALVGGGAIALRPKSLTVDVSTPATSAPVTLASAVALVASSAPTIESAPTASTSAPASAKHALGKPPKTPPTTSTPAKTSAAPPTTTPRPPTGFDSE